MGFFTADLLARLDAERAAAEAAIARAEVFADPCHEAALDPAAAHRVRAWRGRTMGLLRETNGAAHARATTNALVAAYVRLFSLGGVPVWELPFGALQTALLQCHRETAERIEYELLRRGWWLAV